MAHNSAAKEAGKILLDMAPRDYHLVPALKQNLDGHRLKERREMTRWLKAGGHGLISAGDRK